MSTGAELRPLLLAAIPALPVREIARAVGWYVAMLGFERHFEGPDYAIVRRDSVEIHLWLANDPLTPGAEPFIPGTASCRLRVSGVDGFYAECRDKGIVHPGGHLRAEPWGTREFTVVDADNNAVTMFESVE